MKDSCSFGRTIYELDGNTIRKHDLTTDPPTVQEITFSREIIAIAWYSDIALPISMGTPEKIESPFIF